MEITGYLFIVTMRKGGHRHDHDDERHNEAEMIERKSTHDASRCTRVEHEPRDRLGKGGEKKQDAAHDSPRREESRAVLFVGGLSPPIEEANRAAAGDE